MPRRIVFVCTGNSCRSPLAEVLARARYADLPLDFASAGTDAVAGMPASEAARAVARGFGLDLDGHRSTPLDAAVLADTAWLIGLTRTHAALLHRRVSGVWTGRIGLLGVPGRDWRRDGPLPEGNADPDPDIADPWHQELEIYRRTGQRIDGLLAAWIDVFRELCPERINDP